MSFKIELKGISLLDRFDNIVFAEKQTNIKKLSKLFKSASSQERRFQQSLNLDSVLEQKIYFSDEEIQAAIKRLEKNDDLSKTSAAGFNLAIQFNGDTDIETSNREYNSWYEVLNKVEPVRHFHYPDKYSLFLMEQEPFVLFLIKAILSLFFPSFRQEWLSKVPDPSYILSNYEADIQEKIIADLYIRNAIRSIKNDLISNFKSLHLISIQTHLKEVLFEYFDIVFSLKKEVVLISKHVINSITTSLIKHNDERRNIRYISVTC
ncbi:hypothetical protein INQ51_21355 [Maribellus sp. CM-23]|uniref:hypothetical protein n=1 Tax=Maribellus sp. CM-23 TaxID=2781026 RepID=UPI001F39A3CF|nr:hypothetical protein [Maribellus sp. CM-23]MCE4566884.1 hypothetical protein [Maribellus sp. CM-23]